jgi:hypothetical protein
MAYNITQHPSHPPQPHTVYYTVQYTVRLLWEGGGEVGEVRENERGQQFTRGAENTNMTDCISSL